MTRQITAGLLSLGIAFSVVAAPKPARAGSEDVALIVTSALATFALIEMFGNKSNDDPKKKTKTSTTYSKNNPPSYYTPPPYYGAPPRPSRPVPPGHGKHQYNYWQANHVVPSQCYYRYSARGGMQGVFGERCIAGVTGSAAYLPTSCRRSDGQQFSKAPAYDAACLRSRGYRVEARR